MRAVSAGLNARLLELPKAVYRLGTHLSKPMCHCAELGWRQAGTAELQIDKAGGYDARNLAGGEKHKSAGV